MAGTGPAPDPNAIRRNKRVGLIVLPAEGYKPKRTPTWPLPKNPDLIARIELLEEEIEQLEDRELDEGGLERTQQTKLTRLRERRAVAVGRLEAIERSETDLWKKLWRTPQAAQWVRLRWDREVALYVRHQAAAELGSMNDSKEARLRAKSLGLTPDGMKSLMWVIADDELAARRQQQSATGTEGGTRSRVKAVDSSGS